MQRPFVALARSASQACVGIQHKGPHFGNRRESDDIWLKRASDAFDTSTSYIDANFRRQWEDDINAFNSAQGTAKVCTLYQEQCDPIADPHAK